MLVALPIVSLMALWLFAPGAAFAAEPTSGYSQTTPTPKTTTTPTTGTSPSKEEGTPTTSTSKAPAPTTSPSPAKETAKTLPFTGFDLRWSFGVGLILMGAGFSIVMLQRRRREGER